MTDITNVPTTPVTPPVAPIPTGPTISVQDLQNAVLIIDTAIDRRCFGGWTEIMQVKDIRDKIDAFAKSVAPQTDPTVSAETAPVKTKKKATVKKGK